MARNLLVAALFVVVLGSILVDGFRVERAVSTAQQVASLMPLILENMGRSPANTKNPGLNEFITVLREANKLQLAGPLSKEATDGLLQRGLAGIAVATATNEANVNQLKALLKQNSGTLDVNSLKKLVGEAVVFLGNGTNAGNNGVFSLFLDYAVDPTVKVGNTAAKAAAIKRSRTAGLSILSKLPTVG